MKIQHRNSVLCSQFQTYIREFLQQIQISLIPQSPGISCNGCHQNRVYSLCLIILNIALEVCLIAASGLLFPKLLVIVAKLEKHIIAAFTVLVDHRIMSFLADSIGGQSRMGMI